MTDTKTPAPTPATQRQRGQVIDQLRAEALRRDDPQSANLALIAANLSEIEAVMSDRLLQTLRDPGDKGRRAERQLGSYFKCTREIVRFAQLDQRQGQQVE